MKVLHINAGDFGSTGKIIADISAVAKQNGIESVLCVPKVMKDDANLKKYETSLKYEQALYKRIKYFVFHHYGFSPLSTAKILKCLKREKPDVVHLHSANCNMMNIYKILNMINVFLV